MHPHGVLPGLERHLGLAERASFRGQLDFRGTRLGSGHHQIDGELFAGERQRRQADGIQTQRRLGPARQRERVDGNPELLGLPRRARDAALVLLAIGNQSHARHQTGGQGSDGLAHGGFDIGGAARPRPRSGAESRAAAVRSMSSVRVERANGITRIQ